MYTKKRIGSLVAGGYCKRCDGSTMDSRRHKLYEVMEYCKSRWPVEQDGFLFMGSGMVVQALVCKAYIKIAACICTYTQNKFIGQVHVLLIHAFGSGTPVQNIEPTVPPTSYKHRPISSTTPRNQQYSHRSPNSATPKYQDDNHKVSACHP